MNKWTRVIATSAASAALAGTALLGATGSASAAPRTAGQDRQTATVSSAAWNQGFDRPGTADRRWHDEITRHHYDYGQHRVQYWHGYDGQLYRFDGHRLARWSHGHWVTVWQSYGHGPVR